MTKKISLVLIFLVVLLIIFLGRIVWLKETTQSSPSCPMDAKICSDGTAVGRSGPDCDFVSCPNNGTADLVGNDRDDHDCIGSAGYQWCEEKKKCLRSWEEKCQN